MNTKTFIINNKIKIEAEYYETRYSWGHKASLYINNHKVEHDKIRYYNRTWESYQFQSILNSIINKGLKNLLITREEKAIADAAIKDENFQTHRKEAEETKSEFKSIAMIASLGNIFGETQKEKNDWKARMLKAGLVHKGLNMPDDWDTLSEDEKQARLDKVIGELNK